MSDTPTPETDAVAAIEGNWDTKALRMTAKARALEHERDAARAEAAEAKRQMDWQNWPNRREPVFGGYEFYVNEEWTCLRDAAIGEDLGFHASIMKKRYDPDDERVRVRRVLDDDAILNELAELRSQTDAELAELRRDKALWDWMESHGGTCALAENTYLGDGLNAWAAWPIAMGDKYSAARSPRMAVAKAMEDWTRQTTIQEGGDK